MAYFAVANPLSPFCYTRKFRKRLAAWATPELGPAISKIGGIVARHAHRLHHHNPLIKYGVDSLNDEKAKKTMMDVHALRACPSGRSDKASAVLAIAYWYAVRQCSVGSCGE